MKSITINLVVSDEFDPSYIAELEKKCSSKNFKVDVNVFDYRLLKNPKIEYTRVYELPFMELENFRINVVQTSMLLGYDIMLTIDPKIKLKDGFIDDMLSNYFDDPEVGGVYSDFSSIVEDVEVVSYQKSMPMSEGTFALMFIRSSKYANVEQTAEPIKAILSSSVVIHVPESYCVLM